MKKQYTDRAEWFKVAVDFCDRDGYQLCAGIGGIMWVEHSAQEDYVAEWTGRSGWIQEEG